MSLSRPSDVTVKQRLRQDTAFRDAVLGEVAGLLLNEELDTAASLLRTFVESTTGLDGLAAMLSTDVENLAGMLDPKGDLAASDLLSILAALRRRAGIHWEVQTLRPA